MRIKTNHYCMEHFLHTFSTQSIFNVTKQINTLSVINLFKRFLVQLNVLLTVHHDLTIY
jgi:hypothetical protein